MSHRIITNRGCIRLLKKMVKEIFTERSGEGSVFVEWTSPNNTIDWPGAFKKLENPTYYYKK